MRREREATAAAVIWTFALIAHPAFALDAASLQYCAFQREGLQEQARNDALGMQEKIASAVGSHAAIAGLKGMSQAREQREQRRADCYAAQGTHDQCRAMAKTVDTTAEALASALAGAISARSGGYLKPKKEAGMTNAQMLRTIDGDAHDEITALLQEARLLDAVGACRQAQIAELELRSRGDGRPAKELRKDVDGIRRAIGEDGKDARVLLKAHKKFLEQLLKAQAEVEEVSTYFLLGETASYLPIVVPPPAVGGAPGVEAERPETPALYAKAPANVRASPSPKAAILRKLAPGEAVTPADNQPGERWSKVEIGSIQGFVRADLLSSSRPGEARTAAIAAQRKPVPPYQATVRKPRIRVDGALQTYQRDLRDLEAQWTATEMSVLTHLALMPGGK